MTDRVLLVDDDGRLASYSLRDDVPELPGKAPPSTSRVAYAAAHVIVDALAPGSPVASPTIDWDATLAYRHHLWDLGLGVAEAMDTAQRGMGLPPVVAMELNRRSLQAAKERNGLIACGVGTDDLAAGQPASLQEVVRAYRAQCDAVEAADGRVVLMASRHLAAVARDAGDYHRVYGEVLRGLSRPAILHWLGPAFDPALTGYWGSEDLGEARASITRLIEDNIEKVDGVKVSLLDEANEVALRRMLPAGARVYTGDDFNYPSLIEGDEHGHSDALLGIFGAIAPIASAALTALDAGDNGEFNRLLAPTVPLSRKLFEEPTYHYKTGVAFLAYLRGQQSHFRMVAGAEGARSVAHLCALFRLADQAGLVADQELAVERIRPVLALAGVSEGSGR